MKKKASLFAIISGACFILHVIIRQLLYWPSVHDESLLTALATPSFWINYGPLIVFSVMLILQKKNIVTLCAWGVPAILSIIAYVYDIILFIDYHYPTNMNISNFFRIAYLLFMAVILLAVCLPKLKQFAEKISVMWFVPMILISGDWIFYNMAYRGFRLSHIPFWYKDSLWRIIDLIEIAAVVFFCLWLWYDWGKPKWTKKSPALVETTPALSVADQLLHYKELLDMGAITQEEFDAKKKQLLDL